MNFEASYSAIQSRQMCRFVYNKYGIKEIYQYSFLQSRSNKNFAKGFATNEPGGCKRVDIQYCRAVAGVIFSSIGRCWRKGIIYRKYCIPNAVRNRCYRFPGLKCLRQNVCRDLQKAVSCGYTADRGCKERQDSSNIWHTIEDMVCCSILTWRTQDKITTGCLQLPVSGQSYVTTPKNQGNSMLKTSLDRNGLILISAERLFIRIAYVGVWFIHRLDISTNVLQNTLI